MANLGEAIGFGSIAVGLAILLVGLLWSATRRLRNLPDDPLVTRAMIIVGLALTAAGVLLGALTVS